MTTIFEIARAVQEACQNAAITSCQACNGNGFIVTTTTGYGHACDGTEESCARNCPVAVPEQIQEQCQYCAPYADAIRSLDLSSLLAQFDDVVVVPRLETEAMQDAVRGILQAIRNIQGCTEAQVFYHCEHRGDSTNGLHKDNGSYVTEARAAAMIYRAMLATAQELSNGSNV